MPRLQAERRHSGRLIAFRVEKRTLPFLQSVISGALVLARGVECSRDRYWTFRVFLCRGGRDQSSRLTVDLDLRDCRRAACG